jgi:hypothetical protein
VALDGDKLVIGAPRYDVVPMADANRDGAVDAEDAAMMAENWGKDNATWAMGDFNWDGTVNAADAAILAANWNPAGGGTVIDDVGAAYVFERTDSTWTQVEKVLFGNPAEGQWFGEAVDVGEWSMLVGGSGRTTESPAGQGIVRLDGPIPEYLPGDANRDGVIDRVDAGIMAAHWGETDAEWRDGDFNEDGVVNGADAAILAANWSTSGEDHGSGAAVPEPATIVLLLGGLLMLFFTRRRTG